VACGKRDFATPPLTRHAARADLSRIAGEVITCHMR
jgi:hypothetical protein